MEFIAEFHPKMIHFPIAFLFGYAALEIAGIIFKNEFLNKAALLLLFLGILGLVAAAITGEQAMAAANRLEEQGAIVPFRAMNEHQEWANYTVWFFTFVLIFRTILVLKKRFTGGIRYVFIILAIAGTYLLFEAAERGGELVYKYGVGTELLKETIEE
jgi:uncharacterized membrane protein